MPDYRSLDDKEIKILQGNACRADDWSLVQVLPGFNPQNCHRVMFSGYVFLGANDTEVSLEGGRRVSAGMYNAAIHNSTIGNNVYISNVHSCVANYKIEDNVIIENVGSLLVEGESAFGNGTRVSVINEGGGREVPIYDMLSAQTAFFLSVYRYRPALVERLGRMVEQYADFARADFGTIGEGAVIRDCRTIRNVNVGPSACLVGATLLENGSINSEAETPVSIGPGVVIKNFIINQGSTVTENAVLENLYLGQASYIGSQFSGKDLLVFANCTLLNGEACSAFFGPFSTTDHKSSLLIAGMVSFWNAGSGTNQSNHLYKLGPVHQGYMERGCKTASNAYIMWPAKIGAFTFVMGRVYTHPDTSDLPFSYLIGTSDGPTILIPGMNLVNIGTYRDGHKWPNRDRRNMQVKLDRLRSDVYNPYTVGKMIKGKALLEALLAENKEDQEYIEWSGCRMSRKAIKRGAELYDRSIDFYLGSELFKVIHKCDGPFQEWQKSIKSDADFSGKKWVDLAGMLAPVKVIENIINDVETGDISGLAQFRPIVCGVHLNYGSYLLSWLLTRLKERVGVHPRQWNVDNLAKFSTIYLDSLSYFKEQYLKDAEKEFSPVMMTGYGYDDSGSQKADFDAVHGLQDDNPFINELIEEFSTRKKMVEDIMARNNIKPHGN